MKYVVWVKFKRGDAWQVLEKFSTLDAAFNCAKRNKYTYEFIHVDSE